MATVLEPLTTVNSQPSSHHQNLLREWHQSFDAPSRELDREIAETKGALARLKRRKQSMHSVATRFDGASTLR